MRHLAWVLLVFLSAVCVSAAPIYRAGQTGAVKWTDYLHGEVSADVAFSNHYLQDYLGQTSSDRLRGWDVRALWSPLPWLSAGAEYTRMGKVEIPKAGVNSYKESRFGAVVQLMVSPHTNPRLYLLGGFGTSRHQLHSSFLSAPCKYNQHYWMAGLGLQADVYKSVFVAAEGNMYWLPTQYLHAFYKLSSHAQAVVRMRLGVRF